MATANTGSFRPPHFEIVMKNLGLASLLLSANNAKLDRTDTGSAFASIKKLFYRCNSLSLMQSIPAYADKKRGIYLLVNSSCQSTNQSNLSAGGRRHQNNDR